ncbi:MAG: MFS transporter [Pseudomonadota bacterium]
MFTGLASGMPLYLLLQMLPVWLRQSGVSLQDIGLLALAQLPYTWKFLWAPLLDRYSLPGLPRRQDWMFVLQLALAGAIAAIGFFSPTLDFAKLSLCAALIGFFSASLDIQIDAYRRELLDDRELGLGNSIHVQAYRIASLIPGSLGLILAGVLPWATAFLVMAAFMVLGAVVGLFTPRLSDAIEQPRTLRAAIVEPFREFLRRRGWGGLALVLSFIVLYKLGDNLATALASAFYVDLGFSSTEIGTVAKYAALIPAIVGALLGGLIMLKIGINRSLWLFGAVQLLTILGFVWLSTTYHNTLVLMIVVAAEYLGVGLGTAAFVAFMARETNPALAATQFALLSALSSVPRVLANATTGFLVSGTGSNTGLSGFAGMIADTLGALGFPDTGLGWTNFFWLCAFTALPGMVLLLWIAPFKAEQADGELQH